MQTSPRHLALLASVTVALTACGSALTVPPAEYANDPVCAEIMLAAPDTFGGLPARQTSSQATKAWGDEFPIVARCGVEVPGPSTDRCVSVPTHGGDVDWVIRETEDALVATTFGRVPALEVTFPSERVDQAAASVLGEISLAAAYGVPNGRECLALTDVE